MEFAPYGRIPHSRIRKDLRQGTIDQDPEFIDFLESLTNPISKPVTVDQENDGSNKAKEKITVTPLIQFLRDKKANKSKETTSPAKGAKQNRQDPKDGKQGPVAEKKSSTKVINAGAPPPDNRSPQAIKVEKAARDAVRVLNKQAVSSSKKAVAATSSATPPEITPQSNASPSPLAEKRRERGSASAAARILQRDLGIGINPGGRGGRRGLPGTSGRSPVNNVPATVKQDPPQTSNEPAAGIVATSSDKSPAPSITTTSSQNRPHARALTALSAVRAASKALPASAIDSTASNLGSPPSKAILATPTATQAFLKHANPSQGITEPLLEEAFASFGMVKKVEIDKKKGFAYVEFMEPQGLQNAIKASPVKVAQGQVVVLERKTGTTLQTRNMRGGSPMMNTRGGGPPMNRGGGAPMVARGGRGGSMRRGGGLARGAAPFPTPSAPKPLATTANSSDLGAAVASPAVDPIPEKSADASSAGESATTAAAIPPTIASAVSATPLESQGM